MHGSTSIDADELYLKCQSLRKIGALLPQSLLDLLLSVHAPSVNHRTGAVDKAPAQVLVRTPSLQERSPMLQIALQSLHLLLFLLRCAQPLKKTLEGP